MKKILCILAFLVMCISARAQIITATITITNAPSTGNSLTVKGTTFYWTNGTPIGSYMVLITNTPGNDATNLYTATSAILPASGVQVQNPSSNVVTFLGINLSASISGSGWAGLVLTTNGTTPATQIVAPINIYPAAMATNAESQLVADIGNYSTNAIDQNSTAASLLVGLTNVQTFGNKTITNSSLNGGTVSNSAITNATGISGTVFHLTNGDWTNPNFTNGQNFGAPFRSPGTGIGSEQFGLSASAGASFSVAFGDSSSANGQSSSAIGANTSASQLSDSAFGAFSSATGGGSLALGSRAQASGVYTISIGGGNSGLGGTTNTSAGGFAAIAIGLGSSAPYDNSTAIGQGSASTQTNQIALGVVNGSVWIPGTIQVDGGASNLTVLGTLTENKRVVPAFVNSSLANSNNADLNISTKSYIQLSGPTSSFYIAGIAGGVDGLTIDLENTTAQTMVIGNQSGVESTAANRIITMTGADRVIPNNIVTLRYDGTVQRWKIKGVN